MDNLKCLWEKNACVIVKQGNIWIYKTTWLKNDNDEEFDKILEVIKNGVSCFPENDQLHKNIQNVKPIKYENTG